MGADVVGLDHGLILQPVLNPNHAPRMPRAARWRRDLPRVQFGGDGVGGCQQARPGQAAVLRRGPLASRQQKSPAIADGGFSVWTAMAVSASQFARRLLAGAHVHVDFHSDGHFDDFGAFQAIWHSL